MTPADLPMDSTAMAIAAQGEYQRQLLKHETAAHSNMIQALKNYGFWLRTNTEDEKDKVLNYVDNLTDWERERFCRLPESGIGAPNGFLNWLRSDVWNQPQTAPNLDPQMPLNTATFNRLVWAEQQFEDATSFSDQWTAIRDLVAAQSVIAFRMKAECARAIAHPELTDADAQRARLIVATFGKPPTAESSQDWGDWAALVAKAEHALNFSEHTHEMIVVEDFAALARLQAKHPSLDSSAIVPPSPADIAGHPAPAGELTHLGSIPPVYTNPNIASANGLTSIKTSPRVAVDPKWNGNTVDELRTIAKRGDDKSPERKKYLGRSRLLITVGTFVAVAGNALSAIPWLQPIALALGASSAAAGAALVANEHRLHRNSRSALNEIRQRRSRDSAAEIDVSHDELDAAVRDSIDNSLKAVGLDLPKREVEAPQTTIKPTLPPVRRSFDLEL